MSQSNDDDKLIKLVQSCTRSLMGSFREKTGLLTKCSNDIKLLIREGYDVKVAKQTAETFFGKKKISFIAIDGAQSQDQQLDMLIFYAGAFGYIGQLEFVKEHCSWGEILEPHTVSNVSAAIPIHEEDVSNIVGESTEGGIEVESERLPSSLMQFAEYYMAVKAAYENPDLKLILLDRTLAGDLGHLIWSVNELVQEKRCVLQGIETDFGTVSPIDLELSRMLHPNEQLKIPIPRSHLIKYAAINKLLTSVSEDGSTIFMDYSELLNKIGAKQSRLDKLVNDISWFNGSYSFLRVGGGGGDSNAIAIKPGLIKYWERVSSAAMKVAKHIFDTPEGRHPLIYEGESTDNGGNGKNKRWITSADLEYMTLVMIYSLLRLAWEKNVLIIGLIKDSAAAELTKTIVPILQNAQKLSILGNDIGGGGIIQLPVFNSDKQLLQTSSVVNGQFVKTPWRTFEFDACFRTMAPVTDGIENNNNNKSSLKINEARVRGAFKNVISAEKMFVKSYLQLWHSQNDPTVRSHVFSYDRPCYPGLDSPGELLLYHSDGNTDEEIQPILHFDKDSNISHLVMDILCSMSLEVIPECLGHNYPLFLADKKAKYVLNQMRTAYLSTLAFEMADSEFDQQVLYNARFRDFRSEMENARRAKS